jgi:pyruvate formate lyase activating enzyme|uniref:AmmeMemoRadiSam system radical SAM enzyme n=1 Tax=candidate division WOR-3 bacterium TaxID=2052148 RepID=A0A7V3RFX7_UNCW3
MFFEKRVSRRFFLKSLGLFALGGAFFKDLIKRVYSEELIFKLGLCNPRPALYYERIGNKMVHCLLCPRGCVVGNGEKGFCRARKNMNGEYYTLVYSNPCAVHIDPIEKKPLYHFLPGTTAFSIATAGCNFTCKNCQNWDISQASPEQTENTELSPEGVVELALKYKSPTIAYTYTEPSVFYEYMLETAKLAHKKGLLNIYHSNGYLNPEPLKELIPYLDGANVDLKGFSEDFYRDITGGSLKPVLETLKTLKKKNVWLEITNLVIPTKNDDEKMIKNMCEWIREELGRDVPVHFSRFYPMYKLQNLAPTSVETLKKAADIARKTGLNYVYIGNVRGVKEENTYCPKCKKILIERVGYYIKQINIKKGMCSFCKNSIPGRWE